MNKALRNLLFIHHLPANLSTCDRLFSFIVLECWRWCRPISKSWVQLYGQVRDGTRCYADDDDNQDICVQGECKVRKYCEIAFFVDFFQSSGLHDELLDV